MKQGICSRWRCLRCLGESWLQSQRCLARPSLRRGRMPDDDTSLLPKKLARARPLFDPEIVGRALPRVVRQAESA